MTTNLRVRTNTGRRSALKLKSNETTLDHTRHKPKEWTMGRPPIDPSARKINVQVAPPPELDADTRALWDREFARFPAGYFVPSDVRGMLLYLDALKVYERARLKLDIAEETPEGAPGWMRKETRQALLVVHKLQRDLRMFPATRTHREIHGSMANNPQTQTAQPNEKDGWRGLFAVPTKEAKP